jgi:uncharacterized protein
MEAETVTRLAARIIEHAQLHELSAVSVVLHGGEPLLAGHERLEILARILRADLSTIPSVDLRIHTNGVRLDEEFCEIFEQYDVKVGMSVDGHKAANDRHRRFSDGRSSYPFVERAVALLQQKKYQHIYAGLLCTIDLANDPIEVYEGLRKLEPPRVDFLLPHATWDEPPARDVRWSADTAPGTAYADWLISIFTRWNADGRPMGVRVFDAIESLAAGGHSSTESLGLGASDLVVVETDGSFEQVDSLKVAYDGAAGTGLDIFNHTLDDVAAHPGIVARQQGLAGLCDTCQACPVVKICGGGLYPHRFRTGTGFLNPSVFCDDLKKLIGHVAPVPSRRSAAGPSVTGGAASLAPLDSAAVDELAAGRGGAAVVGQLAKAQRELRHVLLVGLEERAGGLPSWDLIARLDAEAPAALDAVLGHPFVRHWAEECLLALRGGSVGAQLSARLGYSAAIAAAAAIRAGLEVSVEVPVYGGALMLPTLGLLAGYGDRPWVSLDSTAGGFSVVGDGHRYTVRLGDTGPFDGRWQPVRRLFADGFECSLDDVDMYRDRFQWAAATRLADGDVKAWQDLLAEAWSLIQRDYPDYAPGIKAGLNTLTPLSVPGGGPYSASARDAFGAVGVTLPDDAATLALLLIHEWQHVRMWAVYDLGDLFDPDDTGLYYAAWRRDPRPLSGLLQGTYAHVGVTDFWRVRRHAAEHAEERDRAEVQFARWRQMTLEAIDTMDDCKAMTAIGRRFLDGMRGTVEPWLAEPVSAQALAAGRREAQKHRDSWLRQNQR